MPNYLIDGFLDPAVKKELQEIQDMANKIGASLKGVTLGGISTEADLALQKRLNAETDLLVAKTKAYNDGIARRAKLTMEQKVAEQALNNEAKLRATLTANETTALQKLDAQIKLNVISAQKYVAAGDTQNKNYLELIANTKKLSQEYDRMAKASGSNMVKTQSMYGATFQLTQVMRELPNFAIDARLGFMALSNNLPMLTDSFKLLSQQIDVNTGKVYGFGGALKQFAKSLLSLNTVMIVVSTLFILFGDKIIDFVTKTNGADKAYKNFIKTISQSSGAFGDAAKKMDEMNAIFKSAENGFINQKDAVEEYNKTFGATNGHIKTFEDGQKKLITQTPLYVKAVTMQAYANSLLEQSISLASEAEGLRRDKTVKWYERVWGFLKVFASNESVFGGGMLNPQVMQKMIDAGKDAAILSGRQEEANKKDKERNELLKQYYAAYTEFAKFARNNKMDFWGDEKTKSTALKSIQHIQEVEKAYNMDKEAQIKQLAKLEEDSNKETYKGALNGYEKRLDATKRYFLLARAMVLADEKAEIESINAKYDAQVKANNDTYKKNVKRFGVDSAEAQTSAGELSTANAILKENLRLDIMKIVTKYADEIIDLEKKTAKMTLDIQKDSYDEQVRLLNISLEERKSLIELNATRNQNELTSKSPFDILKKQLFGVDKDTVQEELLLNRQKNAAILQSDLDAANKKLQILKDSGRGESDEAKRVGEEIEKIKLSLVDNELKYTEDAKKASLDKMAQIEEESIKSIIDNITQMWGLYFDYLEEKIDERLEHQTKANEESVKQEEDKLNAGKTTEKELSDYKDRMAAYQKSQEEQASEDKKKLDKEMFLVQQAATIAGIWMKYAEAQQAIQIAGAVIDAATIGVGGTPYRLGAGGWNLAAAITGTTIAALQTIPYFKEGTESSPEGLAVLGDGYKHELALLPDGRFFVSDNKPTLYNLEKDTQIFPDINKIDLNKVLALKQVMSEHSNNAEIIKELRRNTNAVKQQRGGNFYGMPLINQLDRRNSNWMRGTSLKN